MTSLGELVPGHQLDEVVVEGDASTGVKDGGVTVPVEVCGHHLGEGAMLVSGVEMQVAAVIVPTQRPTWWSVYPRMPFMGPSAAAFTTFLMSSYLAYRHENVRKRPVNSLVVGGGGYGA